MKKQILRKKLFSEIIIPFMLILYAIFLILVSAHLYKTNAFIIDVYWYCLFVSFTMSLPPFVEILAILYTVESLYNKKIEPLKIVAAIFGFFSFLPFWQMDHEGMFLLGKSLFIVPTILSLWLLQSVINLVTDFVTNRIRKQKKKNELNIPDDCMTFDGIRERLAALQIRYEMTEMTLKYSLSNDEVCYINFDTDGKVSNIRHVKC